MLNFLLLYLNNNQFNCALNAIINKYSNTSVSMRPEKEPRMELMWAWQGKYKNIQSIIGESRKNTVHQLE